MLDQLGGRFRDLGAVGVASALSQGVLTGALIKRFGAARTSMFGLSMQTVAMTLFAFAGLPWMAYAIICVSAFGSVTMPAINTLTSTLTPADRQGELQGAQASIMALTLIFSPVLMTQTFSAFTIESAPVYFPGAAFLLAALITATALIPFIIGIRANRKRLQATPASDAPWTPDTEGILQSRPSQ